MISLSCWMDYPVRNAYRLLSTISLLLDKTTSIILHNMLLPYEVGVQLPFW